MKRESRDKFSILLKCIDLIKNWYVIPLLYYGLLRSQFVILTLRNGMKIKLRTKSTDLQAFVNIWIIQEYQKEGFEIEDDDIIIDVGGHIGLFVLYSSQFCKKGKIFSFEPTKENYELLCDNVRLNSLENVKVFNIAISDRTKKNLIYLNDDDQAAHSFYGTSESFVEVETITLNDVMQTENITKCDLLKLDCEGAEYEIIDSITSDVFLKISRICLEYHFFDSKPHLLNKLKDKLKIHYRIEDYPSVNGMGILFAHQL